MDKRLRKLILETLLCSKDFYKRVANLGILDFSDLVYIILGHDHQEDPDMFQLLNIFHDGEKDAMDTVNHLHVFQNELYTLHCLGMYFKYVVNYSDLVDFDLAKDFDASDFEAYFLHFLSQPGRKQFLIKEAILQLIREFPEEAELAKNSRKVKVRPLTSYIHVFDRRLHHPTSATSLDTNRSNEGSVTSSKHIEAPRISEQSLQTPSESIKTPTEIPVFSTDSLSQQVDSKAKKLMEPGSQDPVFIKGK